MSYDFLDTFPKRMKQVGLYSAIVKNSINRGSFSEFGLIDYDQRLNLVYLVLLGIMDGSSKDDFWTIDDITEYVFDVAYDYLGLNITHDEAVQLGLLVVNKVLTNDGVPMKFYSCGITGNDRYLPIRYITSMPMKNERGETRTYYKLTDDGYKLLLSTFEVEANMKITFYELIAKEHLDNRSYDKALDDVKEIFNIIKQQKQHQIEAMQAIRRNALDYTVEEYEELLNSDIDAIRKSQKKLSGYKDKVDSVIEELGNKKINFDNLSEEEKANLTYLRWIKSYLRRSIEEYQSILDKHLDVKKLYSQELEGLLSFTAVQRFSIDKDFYSKLFKNPKALSRMDIFLRPLFVNEPDKIFNLNRAIAPQKIRIDEVGEDLVQDIDLDIEAWEAQQEELRKKKRKMYKSCLSTLLEEIVDIEKPTLEKLSQGLSNEKIDKLIPDVEIFKEVLIELIKSRIINIDELRQEKKKSFDSNLDSFQVGSSVLELVESTPKLSRIKQMEVMKDPSESKVRFEDVEASDGKVYTISCTNIKFVLVKEQ